MTKQDARTKLLEAALNLIREKGFAATSVDELCARAQVTKGAFFHHFKTKEAMAEAAARYWTAQTSALFASAPHQSLPDPRARIFGYLAFRRQLLSGAPAEYTCLLGTMAQECFLTHPDLARRCGQEIDVHIETLAQDLNEAKKLYAPNAKWSARSVAQFYQSALQGAFILCKAENSTKPAERALDHLTAYTNSLLEPERKKT